MGAAQPCGPCASTRDTEAEVVIAQSSQAEPEKEDEPSDAGTASTTASTETKSPKKTITDEGSDQWLMRRQFSMEAIGFNKAGYNREPIEVVLEKQRKDDCYGMIC